MCIVQALWNWQVNVGCLVLLSCALLCELIWPMDITTWIVVLSIVPIHVYLGSQS
jgi:hypothetical protein